MTTSKLRRGIAAALCLACLVMLVIGGINLPKKEKSVGQSILNDLRTQSLLNATGEGVVESYVNIAKKEAQEKAKAEKAGMAAIREAVAKAEEETRAKYQNAEFSAGVTATPELKELAAQYNAALTAHRLGGDPAMFTEGRFMGTSRNTGSDKQTYYKLGLGGDAPDSVRKMAENLFSCGSMDGDTALCEAALSARCFLNLAEAGVQFPVNRYGEYVGYKTDHDPKARATSAGPLTSKFMTEALQKRADEMKIQIFDKLYAVEVLKDEGEVCGLLCFDVECGDYVAFATPNIVLATGGPAGIYYDSVYPVSHHGTTSLALNAGAALQNMTEWQYGLASKNPRWNVSGTYMQVLPRLISIDEAGKEREFLWEFFFEPYEALSMLFLKGYQWPFDINKVAEGSSVIDLLVYRESVLRGRRVYLDFTKNPFGFENIEFERLSPEAYEYLQKAEACFGTPIERLEKMNAPAIELYKSK